MSIYKFFIIAPFDIFGRGLYRYTFEGVCKECPDLKMEDGSVRIFINTKSKRIKMLHDKVKKIRKSENLGVKYMQGWEELEYARQDGKSEGEMLKLIQQICKKMRKKKSILDYEKVSKEYCARYFSKED